MLDEKKKTKALKAIQQSNQAFCTQPEITCTKSVSFSSSTFNLLPVSDKATDQGSIKIYLLLQVFCFSAAMFFFFTTGIKVSSCTHTRERTHTQSHMHSAVR